MTTLWRRLLALELAAFGVFGGFWGVFAVLLADLSGSLGLSPGLLGLALLVGAGASILAIASLGWTSDRLGRRRFLLAVGTLFGGGIVAVAAAGSFLGVLAGLVVLYSGSGLYDVGINAAAMDLERTGGRRVMTLLHAAFSGGAVVGALGAGALLTAGLDFRVVYLVVLAPLAGVLAAIARTHFPGPASPERGPVERPSLVWNRALLVVSVIGLLGMLSEGEMEHWSGVYLRQSLELPALVGASGVAVFYAAMTAGRLGATWAVRRIGNRRTLVGAGVSTGAGMALALATREPVVVVAGFLLVGLALAAVVPIAFSVAGDVAAGRVAGAVSVMTTLSYGGFLVGPALIGGLAELTSLRLALGVIAVAGALIAGLAMRLVVEPSAPDRPLREPPHAQI